MEISAVQNQKVAVSRSDKKKKGFISEIIQNKYLYLLTLPGILFFFVFSYIPMAGIVIAFQDFKPTKGILKSPFVGFDNFVFFFTSKDWGKVTFNTIYLNALFILVGTFFSITIAIMLSEVTRKIFVKVTQSIVILPHFLSWTVIAMFSLSWFSTDTGFINSNLTKLGMPNIDFVGNAGIWPLILVVLNIWHGAGFGSIVYLAAIAGMDQEMYEAARIDGASRFQSILYITLPLLKSTVILLLIMSVGKIFYGNFGMIYALVGSNPQLYPTTDVIDTFVYRMLNELGYLGMASAVGFYQSIVGFVLVITTNFIAKKVSEESAIF